MCGGCTSTIDRHTSGCDACLFSDWIAPKEVYGMWLKGNSKSRQEWRNAFQELRNDHQKVEKVLNEIA